MSSSRLIACGFSSFVMMSARPRAILRPSATSSGRWTKDMPIQSTPASIAASRSVRSFSVMAATGISVSGRLTPLRFEILPPTATRVTARPGFTSSTSSRSLPSSTRTLWPSSSEPRISGWGRKTRFASPALSFESRTKRLPSFSIAASPPKVPTLSFGPWRSARIAIGRRNARLDLPDGADLLAQPVAGEMAHVEPEGIGAGLEQLGHHLGRVRRPVRAWR